MNIKSINICSIYNNTQQSHSCSNTTNKSHNYYKQSCSSNYYLISHTAFGSMNIELIEQMKKEKLVNELQKLFKQMSKKAQANVIETVKKFEKEGLNIEKFLSACAKEPPLFYQKPETLERNIKELVKIFKKEGLTVEKYLFACLKLPALFSQKAETIESNIRNLVKRFEAEGLTTKSYIHACISRPQLFYQSPDTIEQNIRELVRKFQKEGLTVTKIIPVAIKQASLFYQKPETIEQNVKELVKRFEKEGLTVEKYLLACKIQPQLFYLSPDTIEHNVRDLVKRFEKEGLTVEKYLPVCINRASLLYQSPDTIEHNVRDLVKRFEKEGLTVEKYIPACIKASLFHRTPGSISEHLDVIRFCQDNKGKEIDTPEFWDNIFNQPVQLCFSSDYILIRELIIPKMFAGDKIPKELRKNGLKQKLKDYMSKNPNKKYVLNINKTDTKTDCISILSNYLDSITKELNNGNTYCLNIVDTSKKSTPF